MTADETPDVIQQAARVLAKQGIFGGSLAAQDLARALHAAGLLADPADQDLRKRCLRLEEGLIFEADRAKRAEAEVAELRATLDRVRVAAYEWSKSADPLAESIGNQFLSMLDGGGPS